MREKPFKILLVEDELEEIVLFEEALAEIEEGLYTRSWMLACQFVPVDRVADAVEMLREEAFDAVLLDTTLPDGDGLDPFLRIHQARPDLPVIALVSSDDAPLAISLVRQGAQDVLVKRELDCGRLARALGCAMERQRVRNAIESLTLVDELTGLYSWDGFQSLAERHIKLARITGCEARLYLIDLDEAASGPQPFGHQEADLWLIRAADSLRDLFGETDLLGRRETVGFAAVAAPDTVDKSLEIAAHIELRMRRAGQTGPLSVRVRTASSAGERNATLEALLQAAEASVWENKRSAAHVAG